jgi:hypothetical protein
LHCVCSILKAPCFRQRVEHRACSRSIFSIWGLGGVGRSNVQVTCRALKWFLCRLIHTHLWKFKLGHEACNHSEGIFCTKKKTWSTLLVHTVCIHGAWKNSKGAVSSSWSTHKMLLLILSCFKDFEFGNGDGTIEIPRITKSHGSRPKQTLRRLRWLWQQWKVTYDSP